MKRVLVCIVLLAVLLMSGCNFLGLAILAPSEQERVRFARRIAERSSEVYKDKAAQDEEVRMFLEENARAWKAFDEAVNGKE